MLIGGIAFAVLAIVCIVVGAVVMMRRSADADSDGGMSDAEFRKIEGFDP